MSTGPVHEHDCDACVYLGTFPMRHPYSPLSWNNETGAWITEADIYQSCDGSFSAYIVRYGRQGEYSTTNEPSIYVLAPLVNGVSRF